MTSMSERTSASPLQAPCGIVEHINGFVEEGSRLSLVPCEAKNLGPEARLQPTEDIVPLISFMLQNASSDWILDKINEI